MVAITLEPDKIDKVYTWLRRNVPQARHIDREQVQTWLLAVLQNDPDRLAFHLRRLSGIGSSECAVPWLEHRGERDTFLTGRELALGKLMRIPPMAATSHTRRGQALEAFAIRLFLRRNGLRPDQAARAKMLRFRGDADHPWRQGTPDLLAIDRHGKRWLVDIKCPESLSGAAAINPRYVAQLHHLYDIAARLDIPVDHLAIVEFKMAAADFFVRLAETDADAYRQCLRGLESAFLRNPSMSGIDIQVHPVDYDAGIAREIRDSCDAFWRDYVMQGRIPDFPKSASLDIDREQADALRNLIDFYGVLKHLSSAADDMARRTLAEIERHLPKRPGSLDSVAANLSMRPQYDGDRLAAYLAAQGEAVERYRKWPWDPEKLVETLRALLGDRFDAEAFLQEGKQSTWDVNRMLKAIPDDARSGFVTDYRPVCTRKAAKKLPESFVREINEITEKSATILSERLLDGDYDKPYGQRDRKKPPGPRLC